MKRRGFLGIMGGAAVAGPAVAKNAVKALPVSLNGAGLGPVPYWGGDTAKATTAGHQVDWRLGEIERLKRLIAGELTDEEREEKRTQRLYALEPIVTQNVMSLHSVSAGRKVVMYRERMTAIHDQIETNHNHRRLRDYLKEMGL